MEEGGEGHGAGKQTDAARGVDDSPLHCDGNLMPKYRPGHAVARAEPGAQHDLCWIAVVLGYFGAQARHAGAGAATADRDCRADGILDGGANRQVPVCDRCKRDAFSLVLLLPADAADSVPLGARRRLAGQAGKLSAAALDKAALSACGCVGAAGAHQRFSPARVCLSGRCRGLDGRGIFLPRGIFRRSGLHGAVRIDRCGADAIQVPRAQGAKDGLAAADPDSVVRDLLRAVCAEDQRSHLASVLSGGGFDCGALPDVCRDAGKLFAGGVDCFQHRV